MFTSQSPSLVNSGSSGGRSVQSDTVIILISDITVINHLCIQIGDEEIDLYYPIFMTVRFLFIFGWLRVAETLYNPFGEDDEDFELNELLNRRIS